MARGGAPVTRAAGGRLTTEVVTADWLGVALAQVRQMRVERDAARGVLP